MNPKNVSWAVALVTAFVCLTLPACESSQETADSPGELPRALDGPTPRLNAATYAAHGELLERRGEYGRAAEQYRKALEIAPGLTSTRNRLGVTLNKLGRHAEATAEFRTAIASQPEQAFLQNNLGFSLYLEGKYDEAAAVLQRAIELDPALRRARMNYGVVLAQLERYDDALEQFSEAGPLGDAYFNLGVVQAQKGNYIAAAASFEQALANDPGLDAARDQLRQIARLSAVEERGEPATYEPIVAGSEGGLDHATPAPASAAAQPAVAPDPAVAGTPATAVETNASFGSPSASAQVHESTPVAPALESAPVETTDVSPGTAPVELQVPLTPVIDPRATAAPPSDAAAVATAAANLTAAGDERRVDAYASIALDEDPWAAFFVVTPPAGARSPAPPRISVR